MKLRKIPLLFIPLLSITSCSMSERLLDLTVLSATPGPAICFYKYGLDDYFQTTNNPSEGLIPMFGNNKYDVLVAPTQGGLVKIVKQNANYQLAATITFGNFYMVATGLDDDGIINDGDSILIFQENDVPGLVFKQAFKNYSFDLFSVGNATLTKSVMDNDGALKIDSTTTKYFDYIMTAEPVLTSENIQRSQYGKPQLEMVCNVQEKFKEELGFDIYLASIFINKKVSHNLADKFLETIKNDIEDGLVNTSLIQQGISKVGSDIAQLGKYGTTANIAKIVTDKNGFGIGFRYAKDYKDEIRNFAKIFPQFAKGEIDEKVFYQ